MPKVETHFKLIGTFDPHDATRVLGFNPTAIWRAGETVGHSLVIHTTDVWRYSLGPEETLDATQQLEQLLEVLSPLEPKIRELLNHISGEIIITVCAYVSPDDEAVPALYLDRKMVAWLERLGAEFDLDVMLLAAETD